MLSRPGELARNWSAWMRMASRALREILDRLGREGLNSPGGARRYGLRTSDRPVSHRRSRITEGHSNDSPTASLRWRRRPASRTSPFPGRGTAAAREQEHLLGDFLHPLGGGRLQDPRRILPRQPRSAQILTADSVQQQPIEAPEGSEINHGIHRNTRKRESESTSPCRVLPGGNSRPKGGVVPWLRVCDDLSCRGNTSRWACPTS